MTDIGTPTKATTAATVKPLTPRFQAKAHEYLTDMAALLDALDLEALDRIAARIRTARDAGATVYIAGNGGSAATATHWVNDLCKAATMSGQARIRGMSLTDSTSWLTALANDEGYERVFAAQLETFAKPGDVLVLISASGKSPNLLAAVDTARRLGVDTIALLGFDGGHLRDMVDQYLLVETPVGAYGLVESVHTVAADIVTAYLIADRVAS